MTSWAHSAGRRGLALALVAGAALPVLGAQRNAVLIEEFTNVN